MMISGDSIPGNNLIYVIIVENRLNQYLSERSESSSIFTSVNFLVIILEVDAQSNARAFEISNNVSSLNDV